MSILPTRWQQSSRHSIVCPSNMLNSQLSKFQSIFNIWSYVLSMLYLSMLLLWQLARALCSVRILVLERLQPSKHLAESETRMRNVLLPGVGKRKCEESGFTDSILLFCRARKVPIIIRRYLPDGSFEDWGIEELIITDI